MLAMRPIYTRLILTLLTLAIFTVSPSAQTDSLEQHLRDQYQNKLLLLRGFYSGDRLHYDSSGTLIGGVTRGDWTVDGFVLINEVHTSSLHLTIRAKRLFVASKKRGLLKLLADTPKKQKNSPSLSIEAELSPVRPAESADVVMSNVFLNAEDTLADLVSEYWKPCVRSALGITHDNKYQSCNFSNDLLAVPGMSRNSGSQMSPDSTDPTGPSSAIQLFRIGNGISPPTHVFAPEPEFSPAARESGLQGTVTLMLIVDSHGIPRNIRVLSPLGCGLDAEAVRAVQAWKFQPAEQAGQHPVAVEIAVEISFNRN